MMLSDVCLSVCRLSVCRVHPVGGQRVRPAGRRDGAYWLIGPGSAGLAKGCRCALPLQAWAGACCGGLVHSLLLSAQSSSKIYMLGDYHSVLYISQS